MHPAIDALEAKGERNDCTVVALAIAADLSYDAAWHILFLAGRQPGHGMYFAEWMKKKFISQGDTINSYTVTALTGPFPSVHWFIQAHKIGRYIIRIPGHVFTVIDGVILEKAPTKHFESILSVWRLDKIS